MLARKQYVAATSSTRAGFSLIELMIVMIIIGILAALILPAIAAARRTARIAEVKSEMESLKASITQFKVQFGMEPPSYIKFYEDAADWTSDARSRALIKKLWPQFDFSINRDFNNDGDEDDEYELDGCECLVFFLGGMLDSDTGALRGFSKNPRNPLNVDSGSRDGPFFEFDGGFDTVAGQFVGRLVDQDGDDIPEFVGKIPSQINPLVYYSSYDGKGYRPADNDTRMTLPYFRDAKWKEAYGSSGHQLISPGFDFEYGIGGYYKNDDAAWTSKPDSDSGNSTTLTSSEAATRLRVEPDNITTFSNSTLD